MGLSSRMMELLSHTASMPCAPIWDVLSHGLLPTTSSCAPATDLSTHPPELLYVDLPPFPFLLPTSKLMKRAPSFSTPGLRLISARRASPGGCKLIFSQGVMFIYLRKNSETATYLGYDIYCVL